MKLNLRQKHTGVKKSDLLIIEPVPPKSLLDLLARWTPLQEEFPSIPDSPPTPVDL